MTQTVHSKKNGSGSFFREFGFIEYLSFDFSNLKGDFLGGLTSAIVALPLALGFGILATNGDPTGAVAGLYGAIFTGILASMFGGTPQQITGPTGGMTVILTQIYIQFHDINALLLICLIAGLFQIAMGFAKLGRFISIIPQPVIAGFTNGIAILIFMQQLRAFSKSPFVALITMAFIFLSMLISKSLPRLFIGLAAGSLVTYFLADKIPLLHYSINWDNFSFIKDASIGLVGAIPDSFQAPALPSVKFAELKRIIPAGFAVALLGYLETLLASVVVDTATNTEHNSNRELIGQGIGNSIAALFGGIAGTGAIVRTMINIRTGGKTKLSGMICGVILALVILTLTPIAAQIPLAALAGVLMMAAVGMFELEPIRHIRKTPIADATIFVATMLVTVFADLISAVLIGLLMAAFLFINRIGKLGVIPFDDRDLSSIPPEIIEKMRLHKISVIAVEGPLFFGSTRNFTRLIANFIPNVLILDMKGISMIDQSGAIGIENIISRMRAKNKTVLLCGMRQEVRIIIHKMGIPEKIGDGNFPEDLPKAIDYAISSMENRLPRLADYMKSDLILLNFDAKRKEQIFEKAADMAVEKGYVFDRTAFLENLFQREEDSPTTLGYGVAIPHSRSGSATDQVVIIFIKLKKPIDGYTCIDGEPVRFIFIISAGENIHGYLKTLKLIGQALGRESIRQQMRQAQTVGDIIAVFENDFQNSVKK